ncbi:metal-dependent hydrolase family protein [Weissella confusa]|jgi:Imidazolonepropionase and related amidohydrolases|uniref:metal-dependent hydrolase family protein n=1 Tax=Weissella confusa TaxID=1583 RepID=UPI00107FA363|nr:amidohydrolase family protein [Weissella confusa]MDA5456710.1 Amidohydrolase [Weissella confusa]MED4273148.1 amidohydrolase family protein [Weissella confusa]QBZ03272.1 amidohydrolase family protein [Weissella confusa]TGE59395.1 amidohydrolase family protein [Weissella confusa]TGE67267.1 amidohydrolase family protein [Weissella confusa]
MTIVNYVGGNVYVTNEGFKSQTVSVDTVSGQVVETVREADQIVDVQGKYLVPGLINAHTHIVMAADGRERAGQDVTLDTLVALQNLQDAIASGVTTIRDAGSTDNIDLKLATKIRQQRLQLPDIIGSGAALTMTGGHGSKIGMEVDGVDEVRKAARWNLKHGAQTIKLMATGGVSLDGEQPTDEQLSVEELTAAVLEAHHKGKPAMAHAQGTQGIKNAILAGVDSVEHAVYLDDETIQMLLDTNTAIVPTMAAPWQMLQHKDDIPAYMYDKASALWEAHQQSIRDAAAAGVNVVMGTDAGTSYNDFKSGPGVEIRLLASVGMTPEQVLLASTVRGAELLGIAERVGELVPGKDADMLILDRDPLQDLAVLTDAPRVIKRGQAVTGSLN